MEKFGCLAMAVYGVAQISAFFSGANLYVGTIWAAVILALALAMRISFPITIFAFFGAMNAWHWPWYAALIFVLPGLLLVVPALLAQFVAAVGGRFHAR